VVVVFVVLCLNIILYIVSRILLFILRVTRVLPILTTLHFYSTHTCILPMIDSSGYKIYFVDIVGSS